MDYGLELCDGQPCDYNYYRHVGWGEENLCLRKYFSKETVQIISKKVTELTRGVDPKNRKIIVDPKRICEVMDGVYQSYHPPIGDIYSIFNIPTNEQENRVQDMIDQCVEVIVSNVVNQLGIEEANSKLSAWVQVYGDFNVEGLRQFPPIKVLGKRPATMQFNMNY